MHSDIYSYYMFAVIKKYIKETLIVTLLMCKVLYIFLMFPVIAYCII